MIPAVPNSMIPTQAYAVPPRESALRTHLTALGIIASLGVLAIAPWELGIPFSACILLITCIVSIQSGRSRGAVPQYVEMVQPQPVIAVDTMPIPQYVETAHSVPLPQQAYHYPHPAVQPYLPPIRRERVTRYTPPRQNIPTPAMGRAPVGTGAPTRFTPAQPMAPTPAAGRAPVGTGAPTRFAPAHFAAPRTMAPIPGGRAGVGTR